MEIRPQQSTAKGPAEWFTGDAWLDPVYFGEEPSRARVNVVRFSPGARTAWHSHTLGQTLYVTDGVGRIQSRGAEIVEMHAGDVVRTPPAEEHWHGAAPDRFLVQFSITEGTGGPMATETLWGPHVSDAEYHGHDH
jgi:quercetin dioxygenase-like cupin family protein